MYPHNVLVFNVFVLPLTCLHVHSHMYNSFDLIYAHLHFEAIFLWLIFFIDLVIFSLWHRKMTFPFLIVSISD